MSAVDALVEEVYKLSVQPSAEAVAKPSVESSIEAIAEAIAKPSVEAIAKAIAKPSVESFAKPSVEPSVEAIAKPSVEGIAEAIAKPTSVTFTGVIIRPMFNKSDWIFNNEKNNDKNYYLDGRQLYDNLYFTESAMLEFDKMEEHAKDFLYRIVKDNAYQDYVESEYLYGPTIKWVWNGHHVASDEYYPSGKDAECTWVYQGKINKVRLDAELIQRIDIELRYQANKRLYGKIIADELREQKDD